MTGHSWLDVLMGIAGALLLTCLLLIAVVAVRRPTRKMVQLMAAYRRFSPGGALPGRNRTLEQKLVVVVGYCCLVFAVLNVVWFGLLLSRASGERTAQSTSAESGTPSGWSSSVGQAPASAPKSGSAREKKIQLENLVESARPLEAVRIHGTYRGGAHTFLHVQRWEKGKWLAFPVPTKTDQLGRFTAHVEFGQPGRYRLRMLDPRSGMTSKPFVLVVKG